MNNFYHKLVSLATIESTKNYFKTRVSVRYFSSSELIVSKRNSERSVNELERRLEITYWLEWGWAPSWSARRPVAG